MIHPPTLAEVAELVASTRHGTVTQARNGHAVYLGLGNCFEHPADPPEPVPGGYTTRPREAWPIDQRSRLLRRLLG